MPYELALTGEAVDDLFEAYRWYEDQRHGLGEEFLKAAGSAFQIVSQNPLAYQYRFKKKVRGYAIKRFPFMVLYSLADEKVLVIAVMSTQRNPGKWEERVA